MYMVNVTSRVNMYEANTVDGCKELDISNIDFKNYNFGEVEYTMVKPTELGRPDLISRRVFGTPNYWWFIMHFNGLCDPWHDVVPDTLIKYPNVVNVREAIKAYRKKNDI